MHYSKLLLALPVFAAALPLDREYSSVKIVPNTSGITNRGNEKQRLQMPKQAQPNVL